MITASQLPEIRTELAQWLDTGLAHHTWEAHSRQGVLDHLLGPRRGPEDSRVLRGTEILRLDAAELFYISAPMVQVASMAARTIPPFELALQDLPALSGLMVFAESPVRFEASAAGLDSVGLTAVCWGPHPARGDEEVLVTSYLDRSEVGPALDRAAPNRRVLEGPRLVYSFGHELRWRLGGNEDVAVPEDHPLARLAPILRSTWLLMQQTSVSTEREVTAPRPARRRLQRAGETPREVRLIELGRSTASSGEAGGSGREYHHQWVVRGHWRQQWYPRRQVHRPVWIDPHLRGPAEAPLLGGEKVHILRGEREDPA